jgi:tRNA/rRNA methyltransferase/tRNA (cytidine32/uridine32-2'-O)-methyltransferase
MKNMGLTRLRLVSPDPLDEKTVLSRAVHAADVWEGALFYESLVQAAGDCSLLVGTTRRRGRRRKSVTMTPRTLAGWLAQKGALSLANSACGSIAIVFGNERTGLDDFELDLCNIASHIPVSEDFPSLNLSHSVQIYAYELFLASGRAANEPVKGEWTPLERQKADELTASITDTLAGLGFYKNPGREEQAEFLRDLISRAGLSEREGQYLAKIFAKAARLGVLHRCDG